MERNDRAVRDREQNLWIVDAVADWSQKESGASEVETTSPIMNPAAAVRGPRVTIGMTPML